MIVNGVGTRCRIFDAKIILKIAARKVVVQFTLGTQEIRNGGRLLTEGEIVVESLRYRAPAKEHDS